MKEAIFPTRRRGIGNLLTAAASGVFGVMVLPSLLDTDFLLLGAPHSPAYESCAINMAGFVSLGAG